MIDLTTSESKLLTIIKRQQPISKYQLWKTTNHNSYSTVWNLCNILLAKGVIVEEQKINKKGKLVNMVSIK